MKTVTAPDPATPAGLRPTSARTGVTPGDPAQRRILGVLAAAQVIGGIGNGAGLAVGALLVRDITGSSGLAGLATVMLALGSAAATMPLATLAMRAGRRPALATGWLLGAAGAAATVVGATAASTPVVLSGLVLFGVSTAANLQSRFAATDRADPDHVGRSLSLVVWATTVGAVAGPNLTGPGARLAGVVGVPDLAGPVLISAVAFALAALLMVAALRPDPLAVGAGTASGSPRSRRVRDAVGHLRGPARIAVVTAALSHAVMVGVMALTPVHMADHGSALRIIGLTISLHIAGMFALSPVMGWMTDRWGPLRVIGVGQATLIAAVATAGTADGAESQITVGLVLLGLGWSASVIAAAALLTRSVVAQVRPAAQGFSDLAMNLGGATGGLVAGVVVAWLGFGALTLAAGLLTLPVLAMVFRARHTVDTTDG